MPPYDSAFIFSLVLTPSYHKHSNDSTICMWEATGGAYFGACVQFVASKLAAFASFFAPMRSLVHVVTNTYSRSLFFAPKLREPRPL
jgi:hypothetical protein